MNKRLLIIITFLMLAAIFNSCNYFVKALVYQTADIDDYKIFHNRTVKNGEVQHWLNHKRYNSFKLEDKQLAVFDEYKSVAFLVIRDGKMLSENYWNGYNESSIVNSFSATKSIISLLIGIALDEGRIESLDQKVGHFLPQFKQGDLNKELTIRHLLLMSSGSNWKEQYASPFSITTRAYYGRNLKRLTKRINIDNEPGIYFEYMSGNTQLLSFVLQEATGKKVADYASEKLWQPLGAENEALWCLDKKNGDEKAYCCFTATARDFAKIGQMVLNKGKWNGKQIISEKYLSEALKPATFLKDKESNQSIDYYGYHWWVIHHKGMEIPYARGIMGQYVFVLPKYNAVVVRLGHKRDKTYKNGHPIDTFKYLDIALEMLESTK